MIEFLRFSVLTHLVVSDLQGILVYSCDQVEVELLEISDGKGHCIAVVLGSSRWLFLKCSLVEKQIGTKKEGETLETNIFASDTLFSGKSSV